MYFNDVLEASISVRGQLYAKTFSACALSRLIIKELGMPPTLQLIKNKAVI